MFRLIEDILTNAEIAELHRIADGAKFVDGRISNPHSQVKNNLHLHDEEAHKRCVQIIASALVANEDFRNFAQPAQMAPPLLTRYDPSMRYGLHHDAALMPLGNQTLRADLSCTVFLDPPESYDGGDLRIQLGTEELRIKGTPGSAIVYPSHTLHEVEPVTRGRRLVGLTFIQSRIQDSHKRELLYELGEVAALEGTTMAPENYTRLRAVEHNLRRIWADV
jgi:PKHD-type hydroxylase